MIWLLTAWLCGAVECAPVSQVELGLPPDYPSLAACRHDRAALKRERPELVTRCAKQG